MTQQLFSKPALGAVALTTTIAAAGLAPATANAFDIKETPNGAHVHWDEQKVSFVLNEAGDTSLAFDRVRSAVQQSFAAWSGQQGSSLTLQYGGETSDAEVGYRRGAENTNLVVWEEQDWPYDPGVMAMTLTTFSVRSGALVDADIVVNGVNFKWATDGRDSHHDVANALTHEVGHFIGLDHSDAEGATMFASAPVGELAKRDLHEDDLAGLRALYGDGESSLAGADGPGVGTPGIEEDEVTGYRINDAAVHLSCSTSPSGRGHLGSVLLLMVLMAGLMEMRRRSAAHAAVALAFVGAAAATTASPSVAEATTMREMNLEALSLGSDRVVLAEVVAQEARFVGGQIWTDSTVRVDSCPDARCVAGEELVVRTPGGVVGDLAQEISGVRSPEPGQTLVFFLTQFASGKAVVYRPVGLSQGMLRVMDDTRWAVRDLSELNLLRADRSFVHGDDFNQLIEVDLLFDEVARLRAAHLGR